MIYIVGISIAFFLSLLLFSKKGKTQADKILACWLLLIGLHLLFFYLHFSKISFNYPALLGFDIPLPLLHGPFLFLYTASLTNQLPGKKKLLFLHFIPVIASYLCLISFFILPAAQKVYIFQNKGLGFKTFLLINLFAIVVSGITYIIWSMILLKQHRISILNYFSYTEKINLKWLQYLVYGIGSIWVLTFLEEELIFAGVVLFVLFIGYFGIKQVGIFTYQNLNKQLPKAVPDTSGALVQQGTNNLIENETTPQLTEFSKANSSAQEPLEQATIQEEKVEGKKYSKSGLSEKGAGNLHEKLSKLMADEKVYMESELSLSKLANRLGTLPNYLSQVINEKEGKTFYDYINTLRIEEFKRLISIPENKKFTFLSLSYDCGFNSKSSFNKNFKKATGLSPSEYLNR